MLAYELVVTSSDARLRQMAMKALTIGLQRKGYKLYERGEEAVAELDHESAAKARERFSSSNTRFTQWLKAAEEAGVKFEIREVRDAQRATRNALEV